jgi:hypothetical protein
MPPLSRSSIRGDVCQSGRRGAAREMVPKLTRVRLTNIRALGAHLRLIAQRNNRKHAMGTPAELSDLSRILLNLARFREFPNGSSLRGYDFVAPLDSQRRIDPILWKKYRDSSRIRRFWEGEHDEIGHVVHKPGGAEHERWGFDYRRDGHHNDEADCKFGTHFLPCPANMSRSANRTASSTCFASSQSIQSCCQRV